MKNNTMPFIATLVTIISALPFQAQAKMTLEEAMRQNEPYMNKQYTKRYATEGIDLDSISRPPVSSDDVIVFSATSGTSCTNVFPPPNTSVSTHNIYITGVYEDQTDHERSHTKGIAAELTKNSATKFCAAYTSARHYNFTYQIKAFRKK